MGSDKPDEIARDHVPARAEPVVDMTVRHALPANSGYEVSTDLTDKKVLPKVKVSNDRLPGDEMAPPFEADLLKAVNGKFDDELKVMREEGHHWDRFPWLQNLSEDRKCYSQANEMGQALRRWIEGTPGLKGNYSVMEGTINEGKGTDPRDFYSGNGEHNFIVLTNLKDGTKYYGDPWSGLQFSSNPGTSVHNYTGQKIWEHEF